VADIGASGFGSFFRPARELWQNAWRDTTAGRVSLRTESSVGAFARCADRASESRPQHFLVRRRMRRAAEWLSKRRTPNAR
jgi:hypothetical protein